VKRRVVLEGGTAAAAVLLTGLPPVAMAADMRDAEPLPSPVRVELQINGHPRSLSLDPRTDPARCTAGAFSGRLCSVTARPYPARPYAARIRRRHRRPVRRDAPARPDTPA
jgi:hypothetical protein